MRESITEDDMASRNSPQSRVFQLFVNGDSLTLLVYLRREDEHVEEGRNGDQNRVDSKFFPWTPSTSHTRQSAIWTTQSDDRTIFYTARCTPIPSTKPKRCQACAWCGRPTRTSCEAIRIERIRIFVYCGVMQHRPASHIVRSVFRHSVLNQGVVPDVS